MAWFATLGFDNFCGVGSQGLGFRVRVYRV